MKKIRLSAVAGKFYPEVKDKLLKQLELFEENNIHDYTYSTRAIIVPHAGYIYSGQLASNAFQYLDKKAKNVFIIAPPHYMPVESASVSDFESWSTPLGEIEVNQQINKELGKKFGCQIQNDAFLDEHSIEVEIPFIQKYLPEAKIIPILVSDPKKVTEIIEYYWQNPENAFVISSDLSHFYPTQDAKKIDYSTAEMIECNNTQNFDYNRACGAAGVLGLMEFAKSKKFSLIRVGMYNSGDVTGDNSRVVGYGSWLLYEGTKGKFIKNYFSDYVIDVCKRSILAKLNNESLVLDSIPAVFQESGACFVTLEKNGDLRGCIGSIIAHRRLIDDLSQNAINSAFSDPRFESLKKHEFEELEINVSILSAPEKMEFEDEQDLLSQIKKDIDGIIIKDRGYQAVYLPSVWEQLPEKEMFLKSLKIKAGMVPQYFSDTFEAYRFTTEYIKS